jgi:hypothetical protein
MIPAIAIPDSKDVLELAPTTDDLGYTASITRRRRDGSAAWTILPRSTEIDDAWTAVRLDGPQVVANSWSCYEVRFGLPTGTEIARLFTK